MPGPGSGMMTASVFGIATMQASAPLPVHSSSTTACICTSAAGCSPARRSAAMMPTASISSAIRAALRDRAAVTPVDVPVGGAASRGWQVVVNPFAADEHKARLRGLDGGFDLYRRAVEHRGS